jgi:DNA polymerase-3 subunit epsilon/ATP-dependent DNA helicase DinG
MAERVFVALDLETTGLDARTDAIIEIGAVRFAYDRNAGPFSCRVLERFITLVNPQRAIPLRIQQLTGIRDHDVADAPVLAKVLPELLAFVRADVEAVVAHNAAFDFGFLQAAGVDFHRPTQDTFELAAILLPTMSSYSLGELTRILAISLPDAHRAGDDAEATAHLFTHLLGQIDALPSWVCATLAACSNGVSTWPPRELFHPMDFHGHAPQPPPLLTQPVNPITPIPTARLLDQNANQRHVAQADLTAAFTALADLLGEQYETRQGQIDMAHHVLHALNVGDHLLIEAGTGTGKSLAYLLPAALWSNTNQRRVVIATNTLALQDQLLEKEIPLLAAVMAAQAYPAPIAALLKGRSNYLCTRQLFRWYYGRKLSPLELRVLAKILVWLLHTQTGDMGELFLPTPTERMIAARVASDAATCSPERCGPGTHPFTDFYFQARAIAEQANLLVVNHALLLADIAADGRVLPPYSHLVIDESHHLEEAATEQLSYRVEWAVLQGLLQRLQPEGELYGALQQGILRQEDEPARQRCANVATGATQTAAALRRFAGALLAFAEQQEAMRHDSAYAQRLGLDSRIRIQPAWSELEIQWDVAAKPLRALVRHAIGLYQLLEQQQWWREEPFATHLHDLQDVAERLSQSLGWLDRIVLATPSHHKEVVTWLEVNETANDATLVAAPLYVHETLEKELVHGKRCAIFTGATLRTGSGFSFIRDRLGLWDVTANTVESPFDYRRSTLLYLPSDIPEPNQSHYQQAVEQAVIKAAIASAGATLALFTSYAQLRATAEAIRAPLDRMGITVLQHGTSSRQRLLREYRAADRAVLLGTRSFWEGIDLPGDELRCLLIVRLPFAVPSDPLVAARSAELDNPFRDYTLPDAIIRFRQGFGRLIRRASDRGVVVILDSRVWRKEYGNAFLESLPECTTRHAPLANLGPEIKRWFTNLPTGLDSPT